MHPRDEKFFFICIPIRLLLPTVLLATHHVKIRKFFGIVFCFIAMGFAVQFFLNSTDTFFGGPTWWQPLRILHSLLYATAGWSMLMRPESNLASIVLYFDAIIGLSMKFVLNKP